MTPTELLERIAAGESQTLEFKTSFDEAGIDSLVPFAQKQPGFALPIEAYVLQLLAMAPMGKCDISLLLPLKTAAGSALDRPPKTVAGLF